MFLEAEKYKLCEIYSIVCMKKHVLLKKMFINIGGSLNKFPDFFCMGTFIDSTHMKL